MPAIVPLKLHHAKGHDRISHSRNGLSSKASVSPARYLDRLTHHIHILELSELPAETVEGAAAA
jgi:hypothetical protein